MRILLTNDDGLYSVGLQVLIKELSKNENLDLLVIAPSTERSGVGKSLTFHKPLRLLEVEKRDHLEIYEVTGTPADAVLFGIYSKEVKPPDLVISGVNFGLNLCYHSILTSGTVAAALEAAIHGVFGIAVSMETKKEFWFNIKNAEIYSDTLKDIARFLMDLIKKFEAEGFPQGIDLFNINFPEDYKYGREIRIAKPCRRRYENYLIKRMDPRGVPYYWIGSDEIKDYPEKSDIKAIKEGFVSITPISIQNLVADSLIMTTQEYFK
ncbi:MAG: 5'/3'-nucleotidase SurE [Candidatus Asgardarchaeia archaeon]